MGGQKSSLGIPNKLHDWECHPTITRPRARDTHPNKLIHSQSIICLGNMVSEYIIFIGKVESRNHLKELIGCLVGLFLLLPLGA
jgi:hypothetical protein